VKRVLVIGPVPPPQGGIASVLEDLVNSELSLSYRFDLFPRQPSLPKNLRGPVQRTVFRLRRFLRFFIVLLRDRYDLVHIHSPDAAFLGTVIFTALARLARVPVLLHLHGTDWQSFYPEASEFRKMYTRLGLSLPERVLVLYALWKEEIARIAPRARVEVLRNLAHDDLPPSEGESRALRHRCGIAQDDFLVVTVGSVGKRKGTFEILEAAADIAQRDPRVKFVLVGAEEKPGEFAEARRRQQQLGVEKSVKLTGEVPRETIPNFLAAADVFLLPTYFEGMPVSILEAMRAGLAIITTPVAGVPEMFTAEGSCIFIRPGFPDQITAALLRLTEDESLRQSLGQNARAVFEERFEFSRGIEQVKLLYASLVKA
jgi:glycosyltransferase involved in cell wall biosynthesis